MRTVVITRETPGKYDIPGAEVVIGRPVGYMASGELRAFVATHAPVHALVTMFHDAVDDALLDAAGGELAVLCNFASGHENVDVGACERRGVVVCNTPDAVTEGAADMAWALLLAAARRLPECHDFVRSGQWAREGLVGMGEFLGLDIAGRTLLVVGAGRIGTAVAMRSLGWGMRVRYVARSRHHAIEQAPLNARRVALEEGLREADFVCLHTPLTEETRHLIGADELALMKPRAVLVNVSRGPVIDEAALVEALRGRRIYAAGLDVFEEEPALAPGLAELPNLVMTPHVGSGAGLWREKMAEIISENIRAIFEGATPPNRVRAPGA